MDGELYESLEKILEPSFYKHQVIYSSLKTHLDRVNFFINNLPSTELFYEFIEDSKNDGKAVEFREKGNIHFKNGAYSEATKCYTSSLGSAKTKPVAALAYGNRSAALSKMGLHKECVVDIDRALKHECPQNIVPKLLSRRNLSMTVQQSNETTVKKLVIQNKNNLIESASDCITIKDNKQYGKHIVASRNIEIGELLVVEEPFTTRLVKDHLLFCEKCLSRCYNPIPCRGCTQVFYCSEKCRAQALELYHKYECPILYWLINFFGPMKDILLFALKLTMIVFPNFIQPENKNVYCSDRYEEVFDLLTHFDQRPLRKCYVMSCISALVFNCVADKTMLFKDYTNMEDFFKELFLYNLQLAEINCLKIGRHEIDDSTGLKTVGYAWGMYSLSSLFNHSCHPNAFFYNQGATIVIRTNSNIKKGEQCFISYGYYYTKEVKPVRQAMLKKHYYFTCNCIACERNWPPCSNVTNKSRRKFIDEVKEKLQQRDKKFAKHILPQLVDALKEIGKDNPSAYIAELHKLIIYCYRLCDTMY